MSDELGQLPIAALQWAVEAGPEEVEDLARILRDVNEGGPLVAHPPFVSERTSAIAVCSARQYKAYLKSALE